MSENYLKLSCGSLGLISVILTFGLVLEPFRTHNSTIFVQKHPVIKILRCNDSYTFKFDNGSDIIIDPHQAVIAMLDAVAPILIHTHGRP